MIPAGYMAKRVEKRPEWLKASQVSDIYSVSGCFTEDFGDYINNWEHNGYWLFDSPEIIKRVASENSIQLEGTSLFYYEVHDQDFDDGTWQPFAPKPPFTTNVTNSMAERLPTNAYCLFASFEEAETNLNNLAFEDCEFGPYRIFSVYSVDWL